MYGLFPINIINGLIAGERGDVDVVLKTGQA